MNLLVVDATLAVIRELAARHSITAIIHSAGVIRLALIEDVELSDVEYLARLHIHAAITLVQGTLEAMKAAHFGRVDRR